MPTTSAAAADDLIAKHQAEVEQAWAELFRPVADCVSARARHLRDAADKLELAQQLVRLSGELEVSEEVNAKLRAQLRKASEKLDKKERKKAVTPEEAAAAEWLRREPAAAEQPERNPAGPDLRLPTLGGLPLTYESVTSVAQAVSAVRYYARNVVIPSEVAAAAGHLDGAAESGARARDVLDGLLALEAYAEDCADFNDFSDWCHRSDSPLKWAGSKKKLAMSESKSVRSRFDLWGDRVLPVSADVDPSGRVEMLAHLKLNNGRLAPRLYFYDDTRGATGKIHVGYIGRHLPTKRHR